MLVLLLFLLLLRRLVFLGGFFRYFAVFGFLLGFSRELGDGAAEAEAQAAAGTKGRDTGLSLHLDEIAQVLGLGYPGQCNHLKIN